jgi:hypothetical protein
MSYILYGLMEKNYVHTGCKHHLLQPLISTTWRPTKIDQSLQNNPLVICFSSIYMDQQLVYVRGCKRDSLPPVCKEFFPSFCAIASWPTCKVRRSTRIKKCCVTVGRDQSVKGEGRLMLSERSRAGSQRQGRWMVTGVREAELVLEAPDRSTRWQWGIWAPSMMAGIGHDLRV